LNQSRKSRVERRRIPDRFSQTRQHLLLQELPPYRQWLAPEVLAAEHHEVEHVVHDRRWRRAVVLKRIERRTALLVERHQLTVNHCVVGKPFQRLHNCGVPGVEVVVIAGSHVH
jgi:hypothetical protein